MDETVVLLMSQRVDRQSGHGRHETYSLQLGHRRSGSQWRLYPRDLDMKLEEKILNHLSSMMNEATSRYSALVEERDNYIWLGQKNDNYILLHVTPTNWCGTSEDKVGRMEVQSLTSRLSPR